MENKETFENAEQVVVESTRTQLVEYAMRILRIQRRDYWGDFPPWHHNLNDPDECWFEGVCEDEDKLYEMLARQVAYGLGYKDFDEKLNIPAMTEISKRLKEAFPLFHEMATVWWLYASPYLCADINGHKIPEEVTHCPKLFITVF